VQVEQAGQEIVNSISIHRLEGSEDAGTQEDIVAVITNNDKTIRVFSLTQHSQNTVLELPFAVNHATISPDGRTLVAVGDYQQAYFYDRKDLGLVADSKLHKYVSAHCMWELEFIVALHVPRTITATGYFSTAWSPSGNLCAVASECGYVSVIDVNALHTFEDAEDAIVAVMPSTRPENLHPSGAIPGAIRSMIFAPRPWDLLIWAEDQGKVCLADLRTGLRLRQILKLEPDHEGYQRVDMDINANETYARRQDADAEREYIRNFRTYRHLPDDETGDNSPYDVDHELAIAETRTLAEEASGTTSREALLSDADLQFSRREQELLDSLRTTSQTRQPAEPRSIHYAESFPSSSSTAQQSSLFAQDFPALARQDGLAESAPAPQGGINPNTIRVMREYIRERSSEHNNPSITTLRPLGTPRERERERELDDALANTATSTTTEPQPPTLSDRATLYQSQNGEPLTRSSATRLLNTLRTVPHAPTNGPSIPQTSTTPPSDPIPAAEQPLLDAARRRRALLRARERAALNPNSNVNPAEAAAAARYHARLGNFVTRGDYYDPALGYRTAGLAMSSDGRRLWAACDRGIFEFEVDVRSRMGSVGWEWK
jgi:hypothetical protein